MGELSKLAKKHGTDKEWHGYCPYYESHLPARDAEFSLLEIGIKTGASLRMWRDFFPNAHIYGVDINQGSIFQEDRITTFHGDGTSKAFLDTLEIPNLQIVVDDGSHHASHIVKSFNALWGRLPPQGWYVVEDLRVQWVAGELYKKYGGNKNGSEAVRLLESLMAKTFLSEREDTMEMHLYTEIAFIRKGM